MMRQISVKIWLPVIAVIVIAVSLAVFFTLPSEEKAPGVGTPKETPEEKITPPEGIVWNVPEGEVDFTIEKEIKETIYNNEGFISMAKDLKERGQFVSIEELNIASEWALIGTTPRFEETGEYIGTEGVAFLLRNVNKNWEIAVAGDEKFCQWLPLVPDSLISIENKEFYQMFCPEE